MTNSTTREKNDKEWLEFVSFSERALGISDPILLDIKQSYINNNGTNSVAAFYNNKLGTDATFSRDLSFKNLIKNENFTLKVLGKTLASIQTWIETYNNADWSIRTYNAPQDNIYIKCKPVDDDQMPIESSFNTITTPPSSVSVLQAARNLLSPEEIFDNIGLQILIGVLFLAITYFVGTLIFIKYPKNVIENAPADIKIS
jgi:hypothetical protein